MHILIDENGNYEPNSATKKRWLYTRKKEFPIGDIVFPGLYETYNFKVDRFLFILVLAFEFYGLYVFFNILPNPFLAFIGFGVDLFFAIFSHIYKAKFCEAKNKKLLAEKGISFTDGKSPEYERVLQKKKKIWCVIWELFWYTGIAALALVKVLSIFSYAAGLVIGFKIFLILIYVSTAYIHIFHTGYFLSELWFRLWLKKERKIVDHAKIERFKSDLIHDGLEVYRKFPLENLYKTEKVNKQIILTPNEQKLSVFNNWGILQDEELIGLVSAQPDELKQKLAIELVHAQVKMLSMGAHRGEA